MVVGCHGGIGKSFFNGQEKAFPGDLTPHTSHLRMKLQTLAHLHEEKPTGMKSCQPEIQCDVSRVEPCLYL